MLKLKSIGLAVALACVLLPLGRAAADMSPEDREARCANNLARLAPMEKQYAAYDSDEDIARARTGLQSVTRALEADFKAHPQAPISAQAEFAQWEQLKRLARHRCQEESYEPLQCLQELSRELTGRIKYATERISARDALGREIAIIRERMVELQCAPSPRSGTGESGWQHVGSGDCPGQDETSSEGAMPDPGLCTAERAGKAAVCWDGDTFKNKWGEEHGHPAYPWCTYKSTTSCGGGENTGALYYCHP